MQWRQYLTPVRSMDADEARDYMRKKPLDEFVLLDVRQEAEYAVGHIPGAKLIPLPDLPERLGELRSGKEVIVYCASGRRSRMAAQYLEGKGFAAVVNLAGGFNAWGGGAAFMGEEKGIAFFSGSESPRETLAAAYSLEAGLQEYYLSMIDKVADRQVKQLFQKLSQIEVKHQDRIVEMYTEITGEATTREAFESGPVQNVLEGGMTTEEYTNLFMPESDTLEGVIELAMSIETQALDLYSRASDRAKDEKSRLALTKIADEERTHLAQLGKLMNKLLLGE